MAGQSRQQAIHQLQAHGSVLSRHLEAQPGRPVHLVDARLLGEQLDQIGRVDLGLLGEVEIATALAHLHPANAKGGSALTEGGQLQQGFGRLRQQAETVDQLHFQLAQLLFVRRARNPLVHGEAHVDVRDVVVRQERRQAQLHLGVLAHQLLE